LLQAPIVWRAEFDWMSGPTMTVSGLSAIARAAKFHVAEFVPSERYTGEIVALDEDTRTAQGARQLRGFLERGRGERKTNSRNACEPLADPGISIGIKALITAFLCSSS
jgi:hypothetical protein